jgi:hypothetical protein
VEEAFELGAELAALTHGRPSGLLPAGVLAVLVQELADGRSLCDALDTAQAYLRTKPSAWVCRTGSETGSPGQYSAEALMRPISLALNAWRYTRTSSRRPSK